MPVVATCPQCQTRIEVPSDLADQPIRCHHCLHTFERGGVESAIHAGPVSVKAPALARDNNVEPMRSPSHAEPRTPFPYLSVLIVLLGLVFFLLVVSVGFNIWIVVTPEHGFRVNVEANRAQKVAQEQRLQAEQAAQRVQFLEQEAQRNDKLLQRRLDELRQELEATKEQLEDARRRLAK